MKKFKIIEKARFYDEEVLELVVVTRELGEFETKQEAQDALQKAQEVEQLYSQEGYDCKHFIQES